MRKASAPFPRLTFETLAAQPGMEEVELLPSRAWLAARGAAVDVVAPAPPAPGGVIEWPAVAATHILAVRFMDNAGWVAVDRRVPESSPADYDAVVVPGGAWNPDLLRADPAVLDFLRRADALGRVVAAICHGPLVLAEAGLVRGRRIAVFGAVRSDLANAGAIVVEGGVATDDRLVTGRSPRDLPGFLAAFSEALRAAPPRSESPTP